METIINRLQQLSAEIPKLIAQTDPDGIAARPAPGKWSKKEILGHLCDSALHNWQRFNLADVQDGPLVIVPYRQDDLVLSNGYQSQPAGEIAALWRNMNRQIIAVLRNMPEAKHRHPVVLPNGEQKDLLFLANDYLAHIEHHLSQIFGNRNILPTLPENPHITVADALADLGEAPFATVMENGEMRAEIYQPQLVDLQKPHDQDEIYVVISGNGLFYCNGEKRPFQPGDLLFVPAGVEHRFVDFTADFKTWVIFYG